MVSCFVFCHFFQSFSASKAFSSRIHCFDMYQPTLKASLNILFTETCIFICSFGLFLSLFRFYVKALIRKIVFIISNLLSVVRLLFLLINGYNQLVCSSHFLNILSVCQLPVQYYAQIFWFLTWWYSPSSVVDGILWIRTPPPSEVYCYCLLDVP